MSSRYAAIREAPDPSIPGLALVRRLEGPAPASNGYSAGTLQRFCLYALPAVWGIFLRLWNHFAHVRDVNFHANMQFLLVFLFAWIAAIESFHAGRFVAANREHTGAMAILKSVCAAAGASILLLSLLGHPLPRAGDFWANGVVILVASIAIKQVFRAIAGAQRQTTRLLFAAARDDGNSASWEFVRKDVSGHRISGAILLEDTRSSNRLAGLFSTEELVSIIRHEEVDGVLISATADDVSALSQQIESRGGLNTPVRFIIGLPGGASLRDRLSSTECLYLLNTGAEPAGTINYRLIKRAFDIVVSIAVLFAGLPLYLLIGLAVKTSSRGTIFFVQDRVGWNGPCVSNVQISHHAHSAGYGERHTLDASQ